MAEYGVILTVIAITSLGALGYLGGSVVKARHRSTLSEVRCTVLRYP